MQTRDFCFWLQGLLEVGRVETLDAEQVALIKAHLDLVFKHDASIKTKEMEHPVPKRNQSIAEWRELRGVVDGSIVATC